MKVSTGCVNHNGLGIVPGSNAASESPDVASSSPRQPVGTQLSLLQQQDASLADPSSGAAVYASPVPGPVTVCAWCGGKIHPEARADSRFCTKRCRQTAFRLRCRSEVVPRARIAGVIRFGRFVYADPPYPGLAARYYKNEPSFAGEVDHRALLGRLEQRRLAGEIIGWALSTSAAALKSILLLCPDEVRVHPWVKLGGAPPATLGAHNVWEPLLVVGARRIQPGVPDALRAHPARHGGELPGRKPLAFCAFLFDMLGMVPGDELEDLFPGTGIVSSSWRELSAQASPAAGGKRHVFSGPAREPAPGEATPQPSEKRT